MSEPGNLPAAPRPEQEDAGDCFAAREMGQKRVLSGSTPADIKTDGPIPGPH